MMRQQNQQLAKHNWSDNERNAAFVWAESEFKHGNHFQKISRKEATKHLYSFIKLNGVVYATLPENKQDKSKNGVLGKGSFGKVRIAMDKNGKQYALKVEQVTPDELGDFEVLSNEMKITHDQGLGITKQRFYREYTKGGKQLGKYYSLQEIKGEELLEFLENNKDTLTDTQRLEIAIKVCKAVDDLHAGRSSKTNTPYAHLDLKPQNILIDQDLNVQIIDFGMATSCVDKNAGFMGTPAYFPQNWKEATCRQRDIYALLRTLHCKDSYKSIFGQQLSGFNARSLLTNDQFNSLNDVLATAENQTTNIEIGDIYLALKIQENQSLKDKEEWNTLKEKGILTVSNIDRVDNKELTTEKLNDNNMITVLQKTKDFDLDFNTIDKLADKKLTASQFRKVHNLIQLDIGEKVKGISGSLDKQAMLNEFEKNIYDAIAGNSNLEYRIGQFVKESVEAKHRHPTAIRHIGRILKVGLQGIGVFTVFGTYHSAKAINFNCRNGFFATKREQKVRQAFNEIKSGKNGIGRALRAGR